MSTTTKAKTPKQRTFSIDFTIEGDTYRIIPLPCDTAIGSKPFRFAKQTGDGAVYDIHLDTYGLHCQCKGFLRHGHCKHVQTVQAAGKLFNLMPVAVPANPVPVPTRPYVSREADFA